MSTRESTMTLVIALTAGCVSSESISAQDETTAGGDDPCISDPVALVAPGLAPDTCQRPGTSQQQATLVDATSAARRAGIRVVYPAPLATSASCWTSGPAGQRTTTCQLDWGLGDGSGAWLRTQCFGGFISLPCVHSIC